MVSNVYTVDEVAEHLKIKPGTVRLWITKGKIKSFKMGDLVRVHEYDLENFIADSSGNIMSVKNYQEMRGKNDRKY
jgi:excisionase family DNA binding protein